MQGSIFYHSAIALVENRQQVIGPGIEQADKAKEQEDHLQAVSLRFAVWIPSYPLYLRLNRDSDESPGLFVSGLHAHRPEPRQTEHHVFDTLQRGYRVSLYSDLTTIS